MKIHEVTPGTTHWVLIREVGDKGTACPTCQVPGHNRCVDENRQPLPEHKVHASRVWAMGHNVRSL